MTEHPTSVLTPQSVAPAEPAEPAAAPVTAPRSRLQPPDLASKFSASSGVWVGVGVVALGFATILFSWAKVAATLDVGRQMPYVVSGAITGVGLIVVGIAVVDMAVRRQDRQERRQQLALMRTLLEELRDATEPRDAQGRP